MCGIVPATAWAGSWIVSPKVALRLATMPGMDTTKDVAICAVVACYVFIAVALDQRLLVLPSMVAVAVVAAGSLAGRRSADRS